MHRRLYNQAWHLPEPNVLTAASAHFFCLVKVPTLLSASRTFLLSLTTDPTSLSPPLYSQPSILRISVLLDEIRKRRINPTTLLLYQGEYLCSYAACSLNSLFDLRRDAASHDAASLCVHVSSRPVCQCTFVSSPPRSCKKPFICSPCIEVFLFLCSCRLFSRAQIFLSSSRPFVHHAKTSNRLAL